MTEQPTTVQSGEFVPIEEASRRMGVGKSTLYHAIKADADECAAWGAAKVGGRVIIRRPVFERFMRGEPAPRPVRHPFIREVPRKAAS